MQLPALGELPQLTALSLAWRRLVDIKPVLIAVSNTNLVCYWNRVDTGSNALWRGPMVCAVMVCRSNGKPLVS